MLCKKHPKVLSDLKSPPKQIYYKGNIKNIDFNKCVAIVGTRKITSYGERVLERFVPQLVQNGIVIVSGFMYGVDTVAHTLAVENKGKTIAVLGNGINHIYPPENKDLYKKIIQNKGAIISEYKPNEKPKPWMFARRNRIIAALGTLGTIIIEADNKSGSLITANRAIELNRPLFAVPGQITSNVSRGTNELIASGKATLLSDISQITNSKAHVAKASLGVHFESKMQKNIYDLLRNDELSIDQISAKLNKNVQKISTELMQMDFDEIVVEDRGIFRIR